MSLQLPITRTIEQREDGVSVTVKYADGTLHYLVLDYSVTPILEPGERFVLLRYETSNNSLIPWEQHYGNVGQQYFAIAKATEYFPTDVLPDDILSSLKFDTCSVMAYEDSGIEVRFSGPYTTAVFEQCGKGFHYRYGRDNELTDFTVRSLLKFIAPLGVDVETAHSKAVADARAQLSYLLNNASDNPTEAGKPRWETTRFVLSFEDSHYECLLLIPTGTESSVETLYEQPPADRVSYPRFEEPSITCGHLDLVMVVPGVYRIARVL